MGGGMAVATSMAVESNAAEKASVSLVGKRGSHCSWPAGNSNSVNMGEVSWLKYPGDSKDGVLKSVKEADGGADASIIRSLGEMVPEGAPAVESGTGPKPAVENC